MLSRETDFHRRRLFWPQVTQHRRIWRATLWERFSPNGSNSWTWLTWMKAITIDSLNICIFSFVPFWSVAVMLMPHWTPYISVPLQFDWSLAPFPRDCQNWTQSVSLAFSVAHLPEQDMSTFETPWFWSGTCWARFSLMTDTIICLNHSSQRNARTEKIESQASVMGKS
jgi:hypothetical protein